MLTVEELKNLKKGDKLLAEIEVTEICRQDFIEAVHPAFIDAKKELLYSGDNFHRSCLSLPPAKPKYNPWRLFKKGDIVRVVDWYGRSLQDVPTDYNLWEVIADENGECVRIMFYHKMERFPKAVAACFLELVTPVEELEPYEVTESSDYYGVDKDGLEVEAAIFWKKSHPNAKAAAEAERDRLNAAHRKEQK